MFFIRMKGATRAAKQVASAPACFVVAILLGGIVTKGSVNQPSLPGIDKNQILFDALIKNNPRPTTVKDSTDFLRKHTVTTITMRGDHDYMRIVFKGTDQAENKEKHEYSTELNIFDQKERDRWYVQYTNKIYDIWFTNQQAKYQ